MNNQNNRTPEEEKALNDRKKLGISVIEEDAWKYVIIDKTVKKYVDSLISYKK